MSDWLPTMLELAGAGGLAAGWLAAWIYSSYIQIHLSDWLPTMLELAGAGGLAAGLGMDGQGLLQGLREGTKVQCWLHVLF